MNTLVIGDIHCRLQYLDDFRVMVDRTVTVAASRPLRRIVLLGDMLHEHALIRTGAYNAVVEFIRNLRDSTGVPIYLLIGNHDFVNASQFLTTEHPWNALKDWSSVTVVDKPILDDGCVFMPYVPNGRMIEALDMHVPTWKTAGAVFAHQEIRGVTMGNEESQTGDVWSADYPLLISGHIHERQKLGANVIYVGTPMQHTFADSPDKTISFFDQSWNETRVGLSLKKRVTLQTTPAEFADLVIPENAHVRVEIIGSVSELASLRKTKQYKELIASGVKLVPRPADDAVVKVARKVTYLQSLHERLGDESQSVRDLFEKLFQGRVS